jgi:predicted TPR repeat methyltransferase
MAPSDPTLARLQQIEHAIGAGQLREAAAALDMLQRTNGNDARVFLLAGLLAAAARQPARAADAYRHATKLAPGWPVAHMELATALSHLGRHAEAATSAAQALKLAPREPTAFEVATTVALAAGDRDTALRHLRAAHAQWPGNALIRRELALCLTNGGETAEAEPHWREVIKANPQDAVALGCLGECLVALGSRDEGRALLERAVAIAPDNEPLRFHLALARGETPPTQPNQMTAELFDRYAAHFDKQLVGALKYRVPKRVAEILVERWPQRDFSLLDLGCGTGLTGVYLGRIAGPMVGIDVSRGMLDQAAKHGLYTGLHHADIAQTLAATPDAAFDCVVANDVFIYVGEIRDVVPAVFRVLKAGGLFVFSCETARDDEGRLALRASKRYAHGASDVEAQCLRAGFTLHPFEHIDLRLDNQTPVAGFIAVATRP